MKMADTLLLLEARNQALNAKIGSHLEAAPSASAEPLEQAVADALQHLLRTAEVDAADWGEETRIGTAQTAAGAADRDCNAPDDISETGVPSTDALPPQAALRLHQARARALGAEVGALQQQVREKSTRLDATEKELRQLQGERAAWQKQQKALELQVDKLRGAAEDARSKLQEKENLIRDLGRDRHATAQERKHADAELKARDARLAHALGELERYKKLLEQAREQQTARSEVSREDYNRLVVENKRLEQQRQELALAFKKAMKLVDVLKRQKLHLEAAALLDISGKELLQAMELGGR